MGREEREDSQGGVPGSPVCREVQEMVAGGERVIEVQSIVEGEKAIDVESDTHTQWQKVF